MSSISTPIFDYAQLTKKEAGKLRYLEAELAGSRKRVVAEVMTHGRILREVREVLANHSDGVFCAWLDACGISRSSAYLAINSYEKFGSFPNLENLEVSAVYELTKNEEAKKRALKLAAKGVRISHTTAKELVREAVSKEFKGLLGKDKAQEVLAEHEVIGKESVHDDVDDREPQEAVTAGPRNGKDKEDRGDLGKCPNCGGVRWDEDDEGIACAKCHHPHGEPAGEVDEQRITDQRARTIKTAEALMREFDALNGLLPRAGIRTALDLCSQVIVLARAWK